MQVEGETGQANAHPWRLARGLLRPHLPALFLALLLMLVQSAATLAQPWLGGVLTDRLLVGSGVGPLLWVLFGLILAQQAIGYLVSIQLQAVSGRLVADAGSHVYAHLQSLPLAWHHARQHGDVLALLTGDVHRLGHYVTGTLVPLVPLLWIATLVPLSLWLRRSAFGRVLDAVGANPLAAGLSGLPHLRVVFMAHVTSGAMSALSGLMLLGFVGVGNVKLGADLALNALAASILGGINFGSGRGGMLGPAVAAFMLVFLFNFLTSLGLGEPGKLMLQGTLIGAAALAYSLRHKESAH